MLPKIGNAFDAQLSNLQRANLDCFAEEVICKPRSSHDEDLPRTSFSGGLSNKTFITANEWLGVAITYLIVCQLKRGRDILDKGFDDNDKKFAKKVQKQHDKVNKAAKRCELLASSHLQHRGDFLQRARAERKMAGRDKEKKTSSKITRSIGTTIQRGILLQ